MSDEKYAQQFIELVRNIMKENVVHIVEERLKQEKDKDKESEKVNRVAIGTSYDFTAGKISFKDMNWRPDFAHFNRVLLVKSKEGTHRLRVTISPRGVGPEHSGCQGRLRFVDNERYELAACDYKFMFGEGYDFAKGGKLPGLAGSVNVNTIPPSGGLSNLTGFSARIMFRENGKAYLYLYHRNQKNKYGDYFDLNQSFVPGAIHSINQYVDIKYGVIRVKIDGFDCLELNGLDLGYSDGAKIDQLLFSVFHGGSDPALWAPKQEQSIYFYSVDLKGYKKL